MKANSSCPRAKALSGCCGLTRCRGQARGVDLLVAAIGYGHEEQKAPFNETNWTNLNGVVGAYAKSKTLAERAAWDFIAKEGGNLSFQSSIRWECSVLS
jgi:hypothetical protein